MWLCVARVLNGVCNIVDADGRTESVWFHNWRASLATVPVSAATPPVFHIFLVPVWRCWYRCCGGRRHCFSAAIRYQRHLARSVCTAGVCCGLGRWRDVFA